MQDLLLVGPALQPSDFLDLCRAAKPESVLFHPETTALRIKAINAAAADQLEAQAQGKAVDCLRLPAELSIQNVRLIALDMDSTLIANECIDDMAAIAGCGPEMARLTREAMEGLWPFSKNLVERVRLLKGADAGIALQASENIRFSPGAQRLMRFMQAHRVDRWIISGGFSQIARPAAAKLGMTGVICNELVIEDGCLTGEVVGPAGGRRRQTTRTRSFVERRKSRTLRNDCRRRRGKRCADDPCCQQRLCLSCHASSRTGRPAAH